MQEKASPTDSRYQTLCFGFPSHSGDVENLCFEVGCLRVELCGLISSERILLFQILVEGKISPMEILEFKKASAVGEFAGVSFRFNFYPHSPHLIHGSFTAKKQS